MKDTRQIKLKKLTGGLAKSGPKLDAQIDKVYSMNKRIIKKYLPSTEFATKKEVFTHHLKQLVEDGYNLNQAIEKMARSRVFMKQSEISRENMFNKLKEDTDLYTRFRKLKGWNEKFDINKLQYNGQDEKKTMYIYYSGRGAIKIIFNKSPDEATGSSIDLIAPVGA